MTIIEGLIFILSLLILSAILYIGFYYDYKVRMSRETTLKKILDALERKINS